MSNGTRLAAPSDRQPKAMRNLREAIALADAVGLDYFGVGEHTQTRCWPPRARDFASAASITKRIKLGSCGHRVEHDDRYGLSAVRDSGCNEFGVERRIDWLSFVVIHIAAGTVADSWFPTVNVYGPGSTFRS